MSLSVICEIMNIKANFRIFVNASHSLFLKNIKKQIKLKPNFFLRIAYALFSRIL